VRDHGERRAVVIMEWTQPDMLTALQSKCDRLADERHQVGRVKDAVSI